ncbi:hypothetical protein BhaS171_00054 [Bacillus phage vB_BhaS-171]|uniref:hypothetical protein n=1 Tax=Bacillus phage vB_BhaS-171 TaxID=1775140 RepID=UPI000744C910|nr:hypothetical protein BH781_gp54 [Bacillus phage vB_BhaS-171]ALY08110.1 hypothetical protein BhaS171_00054 [Bacillus phage vB_BhaS-171]
MKVQEIYDIAKSDNHHSLELLISFLVYEKKVLQLTDDQEKLTYFMQDRFKNKMNEHLLRYKESKS